MALRAKRGALASVLSWGPGDQGTHRCKQSPAHLRGGTHPIHLHPKSHALVLTLTHGGYWIRGPPHTPLRDQSQK